MEMAIPQSTSYRFLCEYNYCVEYQAGFDTFQLSLFYDQHFTKFPLCFASRLVIILLEFFNIYTLVPK